MNAAQHVALGAALALLLVASSGVSWLLGRRAGRNGANLPAKVQTDTLVVRETIREKYPVPVQSTPKGYELVKAATLAALRAHISALEAAATPDTVEVQIPVETEIREYGGKEGDDYRAVVSGFRPSLDLIEVYPKTVYLKTEIAQPAPPRPRVTLGFGATAGPAVIWTPEGVKFGAGIAAGLSFTF